MGEIETINIKTRGSDKRKADTDHKNSFFDESIKKRQVDEVADFKYKNIELVHSMNSGRPLVKRLDIPDGVDVFQYGGQKLNIWEFQKENMRQ